MKDFTEPSVMCVRLRCWVVFGLAHALAKTGEVGFLVRSGGVEAGRVGGRSFECDEYRKSKRETILATE